MSHTYQPFALTPEIDRLRDDLQMNVSDTERVASGVLGVALATVGASHHGWARLALFIAGGALFRRAITGRCPVYDHLDQDTRHPHSHPAKTEEIPAEAS